MGNKRGFTLFEFLLTLIVILIVIIIALPLLLYAIKNARISAFKTSASNVLDSAEYYLTKTDYMSIPSEGISIEELDLDIKNNNFDSGLIKETSKNKFELIYLTKNNYCAMGTKDNLRATDAGCGALDLTAPEYVYVYLTNTSKDSITILVSTNETESEIISFEYSIDGGKYIKGISKNEYTFTSLKEGEHKIKVRVTNEAGLQKESEIYTFKTNTTSMIKCVEKNKTSGFKKEVNMICTYPTQKDYIYEYSLDNKNWETIELDQNQYTFKRSENGTIYTRVLKNNKVIAINTINVDNIDTTLNGAYPELLENMIPVIYDQSRGIWIKADSRIKYFSYENKNYANAVFVKKNADTDNPRSKSREYYLSNSAISEEVYEGDIIGYYVWIPRYRYQLFNVSNKKQNPLPISIEFEGKDTKKAIGQIDQVYTNNEWYTHPAFSNNGVEYNGFWISKFQNSAGKDSSCYLTGEASSCNIKSINLYSLPSSNSITNISISTAHLMSSNMMNKNNIYGFKADVYSHVITNLEWGAVAYLTNSNYGINNKLIYGSQDYKANISNSTTGNITGVYDMSGTLSEMVMANYNQDAGKDEKDNSGFKDYGEIDWPEYIDYYKGITSKNRILGDATGETEGWYDAYHQFVNGENPFMIRGGIINNVSSIYNFSNSTGNVRSDVTFRIALVKNENKE